MPPGFPAFLRDTLQMQRPIFHRTLSIVSSQRSNMSLRWILLVVFWLVSLALTWGGASHSVVPHLAETEAQLRQSRQIQASQTHQIQKLQQRQINLEISDQISRAANVDIQSLLAERDEQIAALRADVAFYERLVGATAQRKGLNTHSIEFVRKPSGVWDYNVVLTQNLNRGAISQGQLRFSVDGVRVGKLTTISWNDLHQKTDVPGQPYSFRYFQQLQGSVMLPLDFTPQRVKISLVGQGMSVTQTFDWKLAVNSIGE
ncbi:hypothetical protein KJA64_00565 [Xylella fastidiosa subsp. multiplex]|nr:conserved hypothetical protein [Xylella fastidiosa M12]ERI60199.1 membrane protein [Xylella fastidiosa subsp. multiplex Griffin-1]MBS9444680.1 hypothetical protein [Xylella fastidiosa subsp. multiplex]MBS9446976.1 hypothetical protein [Xylella fastidiosa subsp. multiplex]MBS9448904.1 hypothetical protein [Xylella fastidiosa subsp. multiplex]